MKIRLGLVLATLFVFAACGGNNGAINNDATNNGATNNDATNNGLTNNTTTNNGATNNGATNNGATNNSSEVPAEPCLTENDVMADGTIDLRTENDLDEAGRIVETRSYRNSETEPNAITKFTYTAGGQLERRELDRGADMTIDVLETWTYDAEGRLVEQTYDSMGVVTWVETRTHDGMVTTVERDDGADGTVDTVSRYTYDENGNEVLFEYGGDGEGNFAGALETEYDDQQRVTTLTRTRTGETDPVGVLTHTYEPNRHVIEHDEPFDGTVDVIETFYLDEEGRPTSYEYDSGADGANNISTYSYDDEGRLTVYEYDSDADGNADTITTYSYDCE